MAWQDLFTGFAIYLVLEGLLPFASPQGWRRGLAAMEQLNDSQLRSVGLTIMAAGLILLFIVRN